MLLTEQMLVFWCFVLKIFPTEFPLKMEIQYLNQNTIAIESPLPIERRVSCINIRQLDVFFYKFFGNLDLMF